MFINNFYVFNIFYLVIAYFTKLYYYILYNILYLIYHDPTLPDNMRKLHSRLKFFFTPLLHYIHFKYFICCTPVFDITL